jgi:hypothetical protein
MAPFIPANDAFKSDSGFTHAPNHSRLERIARPIPAQSLLAGSKVPLRHHPRDVCAHLVLRKAGSAPTGEASVDHIAAAGVEFHVDETAGPGAAVLAVLPGCGAVVHLGGWGHFPGDRGDACN